MTQPTKSQTIPSIAVPHSGRTITLKTDPADFDDVYTGKKTHEIRVNDRQFQIGDRLLLLETEHTGAEMAAGKPTVYTGRTTCKIVSHILSGYGLADGWVILSFGHEIAEPATAVVPSFQERVRPWLMSCFGAAIAQDKGERNHRFLEEAIELVQSTGCTWEEAHQLVDYVYRRPVGDKTQEAGGVMLTLAALCLAQGINMDKAGETELARVWSKVEQIRRKQAAKPAGSALAEPSRKRGLSQRDMAQMVQRHTGIDATCPEEFSELMKLCKAIYEFAPDQEPV